MSRSSNPVRRKTWLILVIGGMFCILTGCQILDQIRSGNPTAEPVIYPPNTPAESFELIETATQIPNRDPGEILIWLPPQFDPEQKTPAGEIFKAQITAFELRNPGINVSVRIKNLEGRGGLLDSLTTTSSAAPGALPSLIMLPLADFEIAALKGLVFPASIYSTKSDESDWFPFADEISTIQGVQYCIPFAGDPLVTVYDPRQIAFPPKMWQEVSAQTSTIAFPASDPWMLLYLDIYISAGGTFKDEKGNFNLQEIQLDKSNELIFNGVSAGVFPHWITDFSTFEQSFSAFSDGLVDMAIVRVSDALNGQEQNIAVAPLPAFTTGPFTLTNGWLLCLSDPAFENDASALKLAESLTEPTFQQEWSEAAGLIPVRKSALTNWKDQNLSAILSMIAESAHPIPSNEIISKTGSILQEALITLIKQQISYNQATNQMMQLLNSQN
jgi:ABC-type glycerol-3-phosphate transport system substrate-binding protein